MNAVWRDDEYYRASAASRHPKIAGPVSGVPRTSSAPSPIDVEYVNGLADEFDGWVLHDSPDNAEFAVIAAVGVIGTGLVIALGAFCIVGAVTVARWLGWA